MSFLHQAGSLLLNRMASAGLALIIGVLSARILTADELGSLTATLAAVALIVRVVSLGIGQSAQYFGAREKVENLNYGYALLIVSLQLGAVALFFCLGVGDQIGKWILPNDLRGQVLFQTLQYGIPLTLIHFVASLLIMGRREISLYAWFTLLPMISFIFIYIILWLTGESALNILLWAWIGNYSISCVMGLWLLSRKGSKPTPPWRTAIPRLMTYGLQSFLISLIGFAVGRISLIMGAWFTTSDQVGIFSVGRNVADALLLGYGAVGPLIFSHVGGMNDPKQFQPFIERMCRLSVVVFSLLSLLIGLLAYPAIPLIFGSQYGDSVMVVWIMMPGLVISSVQRNLENYLYGLAAHSPLIYVRGVSLFIVVSSGYVLAPTWGARGLALASTFYFLGEFLLTMYIAHRTSGLTPGQILIPTWDDLRFLGDKLRRFKLTK